MNEIEIMKGYLKNLNEYVRMLIEEDHAKDYIVKKVEEYGQVIANQAKFVYEYKKEKEEEK